MRRQVDATIRQMEHGGNDLFHRLWNAKWKRGTTDSGGRTGDNAGTRNTLANAGVSGCNAGVSS